MRKPKNAQASLTDLVEKFVGDLLVLLQRAAIAEAGSLKAPKVRGFRATVARGGGRAPADKGTGKPGRPPKLSEGERQKLVAKALKAIAKTAGGASMKVVQDAIGADTPTTKRLLRDLVKDESVRTKGKTRATTYHSLEGGGSSES